MFAYSVLAQRILGTSPQHLGMVDDCQQRHAQLKTLDCGQTQQKNDSPNEKRPLSHDGSAIASAAAMAWSGFTLS